MADRDPELAAVLEAVVPRGDSGGDWERVVRDARARPRRPARRVLRAAPRRLAVAAAIAALAALAPLAALAVAEGWWFFRAPVVSPAPHGDVVVVERGDLHGVPWALTAYRAKDGVCVAVTPYPPTAEAPASAATSGPGVTTAMGCGPVRGVPGAAAGAAPAVAFVTLSLKRAGGAGAELVGGPVAAEVARVLVVTDAGSEVAAETIPAPAELGLPIRFFVAQLPAGEDMAHLRALDASGRLLETLTVPPGGGTRR